MALKAVRMTRWLPVMVMGLLVGTASGPVAADYVAEVTADNPFAWWRFEDAGSSSGSAATDSAGVFDGTYNGDTELIAGVVGKSARLDGDFDYVEIGAIGSLPVQGSLEFWMRAEVMENYRNVLTTGLYTNTNAGGIRFEENTAGNFIVAIGDDSGSVADYTAILISGFETGQWVHVVTTWDTAIGLISVYIDGVVVFDDDSNGFWPAQLGNVFIGLGYGWHEERCWQGDVDEVAVYSSRLDATRVQAHYDAVGPVFSDGFESGTTDAWD